MLKKTVLSLLCCVAIQAPIASADSVNLQALLQVLARDGEIEVSCLRSAGSADDLIAVEPINLRQGTDVLVTGQGCACMGARVCNQWIYQINGSSYTLIFGPSQADGIMPLQSSTNGYRDIQETAAQHGWTGVHQFRDGRYQLR